MVLGFSKGAWIALIVLVVVVAAGFGVYKVTEARRISADARQNAYRMIETRMQLDDHRDYVRGLIDRFHSECFATAFKSGGVTDHSFFDEELYLDEVWKRVGEQARSEGRPEVADGLPVFPEFDPEAADEPDPVPPPEGG